MLTFIIIVLVGKTFFDLAKKNAKNPIPFAVMGVVAYYFSTFIIDLIVAFFLQELYGDWLGYVSIPFGLLTVWIVYSILKSTWAPKKERQQLARKFENKISSSRPVSDASALNPSKLNTSRSNQSTPDRSVSSQSSGRYNKNER